MTRKEENFNKELSSFFDEIADLERSPLTNTIESSEERYYDFTFHSSGGLKEISRCMDRKTGREVAMATLKNDRTEENIESFFREARLNAMLQHPNIVPVYDLGLSEDSPWFTMKFISGKTLGCIIDQLNTGHESPFSDLTKRLDIFIKVCDAIAYSHSRGVIHLDLKPENIQISDFGDVLVCDWGLAQIMASKCDDELLECYSFNSHDLNNMTIDGAVKGTPGYMAPEQTGRIKARKGLHSDIFSLGAILYSLLCYKKPFEGKDVGEILQKTAQCDFVTPKEINSLIPAPLEAVCIKAMSLKIEERYTSVSQLQNEILKFRNGFATAAENASLLTLLKLWLKRNRAVSYLAILALVLGFFAIVNYLNGLKLAHQNAVQLAEKMRIENEYALKINKKAAPDFLSRAKTAYLTFNFDHAFGFCNSAVELDPSLVEGWKIKGELHFLRQEFNQAVNALKKAKSSESLLFICEEFLRVKKDDASKLSVENFLKLFKRVRETQLKTQIAGLVHQTAYSQLSVKDRVELCIGIIKIHNMLETLNFKFDETSQLLDISNNPGLKSALVIQNFPAKRVDLSHTPIRALICLRNQPLEELNISHTNVVELTSMENDKLRKLNISNTAISNLTRLKNMPLESLNISHSNVYELSVLPYLPQLKELIIHQGQFSEKELKELSGKVELKIVK